MEKSPSSFNDPTQYPTVFGAAVDYGIVLYGQNGFPVAFGFDSSPRPAYFSTVMAKQFKSYFVDKDIFTDPSVYQLAVGMEGIFGLYADSSDFVAANFLLKMPKPDGSSGILPSWRVGEARQTSQEVDSSHIFSMLPSTYQFGYYIRNHIKYYPTISLDLDFYPSLENDTYPWVSLSLPDKTATEVLLAPMNTYGVLDVKATVRTRWYLDAARTILSGFTPYTRLPCTFGLRFYISLGNFFLVRSQITLRRTAIVSELYPTSVVAANGGGPISVSYWGTGDFSTDIFHGQQSGIVITDGGLPFQGGKGVGIYLLSNPLPDINSSSSSSTSSANSSSSSTSSVNSSSSSTSSVNSSSSSSSTLLSGTSQSSTFGDSSASSASSSTRQMSSSLSTTSKSSLSSRSSVSSVSSVTSLSSSSSLGHESSFTNDPVLRYDFSVAPDTFGTIQDVSGCGNNAKMASPGMGLGPPTWASNAGIVGGGLIFQGDTANTAYISCATFNGMTMNDRGTVGLSLYLYPYGNDESVAFCISNGYSPVKTELAIYADRAGGADRARMELVLDGQVQWSATTPVGSLPTGAWVTIMLVHDGRAPRAYINGVPKFLSFSVALNKTRWLHSLFTAITPADRLIVGGAPRDFAPYVALGITAKMDEIKVWDVPLAGTNVFAEYLAFDNSSSSSSSTP